MEKVREGWRKHEKVGEGREGIEGREGREGRRRLRRARLAFLGFLVNSQEILGFPHDSLYFFYLPYITIRIK